MTDAPSFTIPPPTLSPRPVASRASAVPATASRVATGPRELVAAGALAPGTWIVPDFAVPFTITIPDGNTSWPAQWSTPHLVNIAELQFYAIYEVHEEGRGDGPLIPAPESYLDWLRSIPDLDVTEEGPIEIGGVTGVDLDLKPIGGREVFLVPPPDPDAPRPQPYGVSLHPSPSGEGTVGLSDWFLFDEIKGGPLFITYFSEQEAFVSELEEVLATVEWLDP